MSLSSPAPSFTTLAATKQPTRMALFTHVWLRPRRCHKRPPTISLCIAHIPWRRSSSINFTKIMLKPSVRVAGRKLTLVLCSDARCTPTPPTRSDSDVAPPGLPKPHRGLKPNEPIIQMGTHDLHCCTRELRALSSGHAPHTTIRNSRCCRATEPSGVRAQTLSEDAVRHVSEAKWRSR